MKSSSETVQVEPWIGQASKSPDSQAPRLKVCLAASGGGHFRQLLDLEPVWSQHDYLFISEDTPLTRSIAEEHPVRFVPHFALGQIRHGAPIRMVLAAVRSFFVSASIMLRERPNVVITTGAGAVVFLVLWARLLGAKVVLVETFARFDGPSWFARIAAPFANLKIAQSEGVGGAWRDVVVFDPLRFTNGPSPTKHALLFVTVGATLPFDRLVMMVADLKAQGRIPERVVVQSGAGGAAPPAQPRRLAPRHALVRSCDVGFPRSGSNRSRIRPTRSITVW